MVQIYIHTQRVALKNFNQESYLPPDENQDYVKIGPYSEGKMKKKYDSVLKRAYEINDKYAGIIRGHYVPILIKIKKIKKENNYKTVVIKGEVFAQMIACLDCGSDTGLIEESLLDTFELENIGEKQLRLNTVTSSEIKTFKEAEVSCLATNGLEYSLEALEKRKIGVDKYNPPNFIK